MLIFLNIKFVDDFRNYCFFNADDNEVQFYHGVRSSGLPEMFIFFNFKTFPIS
jgi:hypothetical protein